MGIIKKMTCSHLEAVYFEERIETIPVPSKRKSDTKIVRLIYCPDCGMTFLASKANNIEVKKSKLSNKDSECKVEKIRDMK